MNKNIKLAKKLLESKGYKVSRMNESVDLKRLESEINSKVKEVMTSPSFGFDAEKDPDDKYSMHYGSYSKVSIEEEDGRIIVQVRAELSYDSMDKLANELNPIVAKYDEEAYFDHVTSGIIEAYIEE